ncbi:MAG TPA: hypothetical protein VH481_08960 [Nitrososphaeraceae archaeon]
MFTIGSGNHGWQYEFSADPVFWLHQPKSLCGRRNLQIEERNPSLDGNTRKMDPKSESVNDILKIEDLDYSYS